MMTEKRVLLNYLPPSVFYSPSSSLSILKGFMSHHGYNTEIKYWNFLLDGMDKYLNYVEDLRKTNVKLLPYMYFLAEEFNDEHVMAKIETFITSLRPIYKAGGKGNCMAEFQKLCNNVMRIIQEELDKIDFDQILLVGFSAKFYQWIPAAAIAREIKKRKPDVKIIIGGFGSKEAAGEVLQGSPYFDYATWGEGEYPLLEITRQLESGIFDFDSVPRFIYRENGLKISSNTRSEYLDLNASIYPDYDEYFASLPEGFDTDTIRLPIDSVRACHWNRCKFCNYSRGYKYREKAPENLVKELEHQSGKYGVTKFDFTDNDMFGSGIERLDSLLEILIEHRKTTDNAYDIWTQMIPHRVVDSQGITKMAVAGFTTVFVGYESISEGILRKMDKINTVADNIFFVKFLLKNGITSNVNIIKGVPDETMDDVAESIENLHYIRFFFPVDPEKFTHIHGYFGLYKEAKYFKDIDEDELERYQFNPYPYYLPDAFMKDRFNLFGYTRDKIKNAVEWSNFLRTEGFYKDNAYTYKLFYSDGILYYEEYLNNESVNSIVFDQPEYVDVLSAANNQVVSFEKLFGRLSAKYRNLTPERLQEIMQDLKDEYLLYFNDISDGIISVIDFDLSHYG